MKSLIAEGSELTLQEVPDAAIEKPPTRSSAWSWHRCAAVITTCWSTTFPWPTRSATRPSVKLSRSVRISADSPWATVFCWPATWAAAATSVPVRLHQALQER